MGAPAADGFSVKAKTIATIVVGLLMGLGYFGWEFTPRNEAKADPTIERVVRRFDRRITENEKELVKHASAVAKVDPLENRTTRLEEKFLAAERARAGAQKRNDESHRAQQAMQKEILKEIREMAK